MDISTGRLRLRTVSEDDLSAFHRLQSNEIVARFTKQGPNTTQTRSEQQLDDLLVLINTSPPSEPTIILAITIKPRKDLIGLVGTFRPREIGFSLHPEFHGCGYAQEAVKGFCEWYLNKFPEQRLFAKVNTENEASVKCLGRCGFGKADEEEVRADDAFSKDSTRETWLLRD